MCNKISKMYTTIYHKIIDIYKKIHATFYNIIFMCIICMDLLCKFYYNSQIAMDILIEKNEIKKNMLIDNYIEYELNYMLNIEQNFKNMLNMRYFYYAPYTIYIVIIYIVAYNVKYSYNKTIVLST